MTGKIYAIAGLLCGILAMASLPAAADTLKDTAGHDSGWSLTLAGSATAYNVDDVILAPDHRNSMLLISVFKDFGPPDDGDFTPALMTFTQGEVDANVAGKIAILYETIHNNTGQDWSAFRWAIFETGVAQFSISDSNLWGTSPLGTQTWQGVTGDLAQALLASGGTVGAGDTYRPSGHLVIHADVDSIPGDSAQFTMKEIVPEPATLAALSLGAAALLRRRRRV